MSFSPPLCLPLSQFLSVLSNNDDNNNGAYADGSIEEIEFGAIGNNGRNVVEAGEQHRIQVVTAVEQEVEKGYGGEGYGGRGGGGDAKSETGSERGLIANSGKWGRFA